MALSAAAVRRPPWAAAAIAVLCAAVAGCGGGDAKAPPWSEAPPAAHSETPAPGATAVATEPFRPSRATPLPVLRHATFRTPDAFVFRVAADAGHLVWVTGPVEEGEEHTAVMQRDLRTNRTSTLAEGVDPSYGVGATRRWVVYAETDGATRLLAVRHDGSRPVELSSSLVSPVAARGELVAWAEREGGLERVIVRDMSDGEQWVAAGMPRCRRGRCYRIESVTLADRGVVFTRAATDPDASEIVRRAFAATRARRVSIPGDPQPELLPSSSGGLYYALGRGWYRWDFGRARPRRTAFAADPPAPLLAYERGWWFLQTRSGCRAGVVAQNDRGRRSVVASPSRLTARARTSEHGLCLEMGALAWTGRQPLTSWGLIPQESEEEHEEHGLVGLVSVGAPLP